MAAKRGWTNDNPDDEGGLDNESDDYESCDGGLEKRQRSDYNADSESRVWLRYNNGVVINTPATGVTIFDRQVQCKAPALVSYVAGEVITGPAGPGMWVSHNMLTGEYATTCHHISNVTLQAQPGNMQRKFRYADPARPRAMLTVIFIAGRCCRVAARHADPA
jgi:hypothetical protein